MPSEMCIHDKIERVYLEQTVALRQRFFASPQILQQVRVRMNCILRSRIELDGSFELLLGLSPIPFNIHDDHRLRIVSFGHHIMEVCR